MEFPIPAAVLAGGASRRMGREKGALPYGAQTLLEYQVSRLASIFADVWVVAKRVPEYPFGKARVLLDDEPGFAAVYGLRRVLREAEDRVFVLGVDLPALTADVIRAIAAAGMSTDRPGVVPLADGRLQPLAAVWRRRVLVEIDRRIAGRELSLTGLARAAGAEVLPEAVWRAADPSGNAFANLNTLEEYAAMRERA
jgi:molybdenum cofactor guanylyltransferase